MLDLLFVEGQSVTAPLSIASLPVLVPCAMLIVVVVASATYLGVERPFIGWGRRLARHLEHRRHRLDSRELEVAP